MGTPIDIWLVGNTGLRNPNRIKDGFLRLQNHLLSEIFMAEKMKSGL